MEHEGSPIGFCQYYACKDSDQLWEGYTKSGASYSIDYMIGETDYIRKGYGTLTFPLGQSLYWN